MIAVGPHEGEVLLHHPLTVKASHRPCGEVVAPLPKRARWLNENPHGRPAPLLFVLHMDAIVGSPFRSGTESKTVDRCPAPSRTPYDRSPILRRLASTAAGVVATASPRGDPHDLGSPENIVAG